MRATRAFGTIAIAAIALAACKGGSGSGGGGGSVPTTAPSSTPAAGSIAYVANSTINTVTGYLPLQTNPQITISAGVSSPVALAVDGSGNLFVDNCQPCIANTGSASSITYYPRGSTTSSRMITTGLSKPVAIAVAANGNLYVANAQSSSITAYATGSNAVALTITNGVSAPSSVAVDASGNIYVANAAFFPGTVTVYSPTGSLMRTLPVGGVENVAVDSTGRVYASNCNVSCGNGSGADSVIVFKPDSTSVAYTITSDISFPTAMAFDGSNNLYVANNALGKQNNVMKYAAGTGAAIATIKAPGPTGVALDKNGIVYVSDGPGSIGASYNQLTEWQNGSITTVTAGISNPLAVVVSTSP